MSTPGPQVFGQQAPQTADHDFNTWMFTFRMAMLNIQTVTLVEVISCTNDGGLSPVGMVTVQPLVNQRTGNGQSVPHGKIYNIPYFRIQGGDTAIILDPVKGNIGLMACASRDISTVKATAAQANPGSLRIFDWADGLYIGGFLNGVPTRYIQFDENGNCNIVTPSGVVNLNGTTIDQNGNIVLKPGATITDGQGIVVETHQHDPGTYEADGSPVTGKSDVPTS